MPNQFWFKTKANIEGEEKKKHFQVFVYFTRTKSTLGNSGKYNPSSHRGVVGVLCESRPERKDKQSVVVVFFSFPIFRRAICDLKIKVKKKKSWGIIGFSFANILESSLSVQNVRGT